MGSPSRFTFARAFVARFRSIFGTTTSSPCHLIKPSRNSDRTKPKATSRNEGSPFPWIHLWRIAAIVLAACVSVGALNAAPVATADAGVIQRLNHFFTQLWSPQTSDAEKLGTAYVYDEDGNLLSETGTGGPNSTGTINYIYLPTANGPMPIAAEINGQMYAIHSDHLNTPRRIDNAQGQTVWQWAYSAFGDEKPTTAHNRFANLDVTPNPGATAISDIAFNLRWPGQYYDKESGLFENYFRGLDPKTGRYTQPDPIGLDGGWNRAGYVNGNPLSFVDPSGLIGEFRNPRDMQLLEGGGGGPMVNGGGGGAFSGGGLGRVGGLGRGTGASGGGLPNSALVCRGGLCTADRFAGGSGVTFNAAGNMCGASVNSAADATIKELSATIPNPRIGVTTVGNVRSLGGDVTPKPTPSNPFHCEMCGITPQQAEGLFTPVIQNPNR